MPNPLESARQLESHLHQRCGLLLSQSQLAELLGRTAGGLRYSLSNPPDARTHALRACARRVGRRVYYPATDVAEIITGQSASLAESRCAAGQSRTSAAKHARTVSSPLTVERSKTVP